MNPKVYGLINRLLWLNYGRSAPQHLPNARGFIDESHSAFEHVPWILGPEYFGRPTTPENHEILNCKANNPPSSGSPENYHCGFRELNSTKLTTMRNTTICSSPARSVCSSLKPSQLTLQPFSPTFTTVSFGGGSLRVGIGYLKRGCLGSTLHPT